MLDAFPSPSLTLAGYSAAAVVMVSFNVWVFLQFFPKEGGPPTLSRAALITYLLASSFFLWLSVLYDLASPSSQLGVTAIFFGVQVMMIAPFVWAFATILRGAEHWVRRESWGWPLLLALVMPANEFLMGGVWVALNGGWSALVPAGNWGLVEAIGASVGTVFFFWSMFANMIPLLYWVPLPRGERTALLGLAATAFVGPWVVSDLLVGAVLMGIVMTATFGLILRHLLGPALANAGEVRLYAAVAVAFFAMAAAVVLQVPFASAPWSMLPFALVMLATMVAEMLFLSHRVLAALPLSPAERASMLDLELDRDEERGDRPEPA
jgi:hypothetical protein